jgi:toxin CptA
MRAQLNQAIEITFEPSFLLLGLIVTIAIVSAIITATLPIIFLVKLTMIVLIVFASLYYILRDCLYLLPWSWQHLEVNRFGEFRLINREGHVFRPIIHASSIVNSQLIVLNFEGKSLKKGIFDYLPSLILFINATNTEQHRLLRVWLRWWKHTND